MEANCLGTGPRPIAWGQVQYFADSQPHPAEESRYPISDLSPIRRHLICPQFPGPAFWRQARYYLVAGFELSQIFGRSLLATGPMFTWLLAP
jgi:hypothetical protein